MSYKGCRLNFVHLKIYLSGQSEPNPSRLDYRRVRRILGALRPAVCGDSAFACTRCDEETHSIYSLPEGLDRCYKHLLHDALIAFRGVRHFISEASESERPGFIGSAVHVALVERRFVTTISAPNTFPLTPEVSEEAARASS